MITPTTEFPLPSPRTATPYRIGILGAGTAGLSVFRELISACEADPGRRPLEITLVNPRNTLGRGLNYGADQGQALLNRSVEAMDLLSSRSGSFAAWAKERGYWNPASEAAQSSFLRRDVFGSYLLDVFSETLERARRCGIRVNIDFSTATSVVRTETGYRIGTREGTSHLCDGLVLAIGNLPSVDHFGLSGHRGYVPAISPLLSNRVAIPEGAPVALLGTRLSAIDVALHLLDRGHQGHIWLVSRGGRLPSVRSSVAPVPLSVISPKGIQDAAKKGLTLKKLATLLRRELNGAGARFRDLGLARRGRTAREFLESDLKAAAAGAVWQSVLLATNASVETAWSLLPEAERSRFLRRFHSAWTTRRVPIPPQTARRLLDAMNRGKVLVTGGLKEVERTAEGFSLHCGTHVLRSDWVVNATGESKGFDLNGLEPCASLIRSGLMSPSPWGGARTDFATCTLVSRDGIPARDLFCLGGLTTGDFHGTSNIETVSRQARVVASRLLALASEEHV